MDAAAAANVLTVPSIGFGRTLTAAFIELRNEQFVLATRAKEITKLYEELKDKDAEDLEVTTEMQDYCEGREALFDDIRDWYRRSGERIADCPDQRTEIRIKRVHDYFERIRRQLRETQPLGMDEEESEVDRCWLNEKVSQFPEDIVPAARFKTNKLEGNQT